MSEKWWDMSDDELDDLFRDASDKVDVPFDSSSFNKLRHKIDSQRLPKGSKGFRKRWLLLLAGLILLVGVGVVYRFGDKKQDLTIDSEGNNVNEITKNIENEKIIKPSTVPLSVQSAIIKKEDLKLEKATSQKALSSESKGITIEKLEPLLSKNTPTINEKTNLKPSSVKIKRADGKANSELSFVETAKTHRQTLAKNTNSTIPSEKVVENTQIIPSVNKSETYNTKQKEVIQNTYADSKNPENQLVIVNNSKNRKGIKGKNYAQNSISINQNTLIVIENSPQIQEKTTFEETVNRTNFYDVNDLKNKGSKLLLTDIHTELPTYIGSLPRTIKPVKFSKFGIRLALSPDFNSIENIGTSALGGTVGLLLEYKLSRKLILQTGITYSNKSYIGSFDDYHNWKEWKGYHPSKPTEVDGGCQILDIPVNLRINVFQKPKQTWFVSSGISSYLMTKESYTYIYDWTPSRSVDWNDNSKYYWSVLNFSVGLERQISKHLSLQIEPYLKTPLKSVGRGGVNLYSSGVLFSTKYEF